jgi:ABC-type arginine transport system ATPase subunit
MIEIEIIPGDVRQLAPRGAKILLVGPSGIGKTSQLRTLDAASTLFVDCEAGDLAICDLCVDTVRIESWQQARELAHSIVDRTLNRYQTVQQLAAFPFITPSNSPNVERFARSSLRFVQAQQVTVVC